MKLTRVEVEGVGRFGTRARLEGLGSGVNILAAENEAGKSTFFKAIRACLFERHGTKNSDVATLATDGLSLPVIVTLGFEHGGKAYEITKSFLKSTSASLRRDGIEIARDRDADESLWDLLGIAPGSGRSVDDAAYGILWVSQGHSFSMPEPTAAATSALNAAIQQEVGTLVGGERARQVLGALQAELKKQLTDGGKPKAGGALAEAARQVDSIDKDLAEAEQRLATLDTSLDELTYLRGDLKRLMNPIEATRLKQEHDVATRQLKAGEEAAAVLHVHEEDERKALALLKAQEEQLAALRERCLRIDGNRQQQVDLAAQLAPFVAEEGLALRLLAENSKALEDIDNDIAEADKNDQQLRQLAALRQRTSSRDGLSTRQQLLQAFETRVSETNAALKANSVDASAIGSLDTIERDQATLLASLGAAAAQVSIERNGDGRLTVNGETVAAGVLRAVTQPISILVGEMAKITVLPPQNSADLAKVQKDKLRQKLKDLLDIHGAATPAALRKMREERAALEADIRNLKETQAGLKLKEATAGPEITRISIEIAGIDKDTRRALAEIGADTLPSLDELVEVQDKLAETRAGHRFERLKCDAVVAAQRHILVGIATKRAGIEGQQAVLISQLTADLAALPDDQRSVILDTAEQDHAKKLSDHRTKVEAADKLRREAPGPEEIEQLQSRAERLGEAIRNKTLQVEALRDRIANLEGQIQAVGGDGLGEKAADLNALREMARAEHARQVERAATLQLLRDVIETSYTKRQEELNAPLRRHLKPFLNDLFPQAEIELSDGFSVSGLRRNGASSEMFDRLSAGTQEQIAVLVRLAMGAMIASRGQDVPIILDDALVFSDDSRIEQMFDALNRAGKNQQVIVLTCRTRTFSTLGGNTLQIQSTHG